MQKVINYYDIKSGIGYHGDSERKIVIAVRLGRSCPLYYQWYYKHERIGEKKRIKITPWRYLYNV